MEEVKREARRRHVQLLVVSTTEAIEEIQKRPDETNAVLHLTC